MIEEFDKKHTRNIEKIDGIYASIDEYLNIMKNAWDYRLQNNRAPEIIAWKNRFIDCKDMLTNSYESILQFILDLKLIRTGSAQSHSSQIEDLVRTLPLIHPTSIGGIGNSINMSTHPQDSIIKLMEGKFKFDMEESRRILPLVNKSFHEYNSWISELEKAKTANYESMGLLEQILFKENNELGRELTNYVLSLKFETLSFVEFQKLLYLKN
jgi:hypothetical protein